MRRHLALPLDRYIASEPTPLTSHPTIGKIAGETRALPFAVSVPVNYFNDDLLPIGASFFATLVEQELHRIAQRFMHGQRPGHSLQATALVNEAYLRLVGADSSRSFRSSRSSRSLRATRSSVVRRRDVSFVVRNVNGSSVPCPSGNSLFQL